jgi:maleamate amidohydrolase
LSEREWLTIVPEAERQLYEQARFATEHAWGERPALLVIDCTCAFTGTKAQPPAEAIAEFATSCGAVAWEALPRINWLLDLFRSHRWPIVHTRSDLQGQRHCGRATTSSVPPERSSVASEYPDLVAPLPGEWVIEKVKASAFFGTPLAMYLSRQKIDTLVIAGTSTSGCVRASCVDASSWGYPTFVVADCCFDRSRFAHLANLFDMSQKYATVLNLAELRDRTATARA